MRCADHSRCILPLDWKRRNGHPPWGRPHSSLLSSLLLSSPLPLLLLLLLESRLLLSFDDLGFGLFVVAGTQRSQHSPAVKLAGMMPFKHSSSGHLLAVHIGFARKNHESIAIADRHDLLTQRGQQMPWLRIAGRLYGQAIPAHLTVWHLASRRASTSEREVSDWPTRVVWLGD